MKINCTDTRDLRFEQGFTVIELLAAIIIMMLTASFAVVGLATLVSSAERLNAKNTITADILRARDEALAKGTRVIVEIPQAGLSYSVGFDYAPYSDPPKADAVDFTRQLPVGVLVSPEQDLVFDARGCLIDDTGALTTTSFVLSHDELAYSVGSVLPTGLIKFE